MQDNIRLRHGSLLMAITGVAFIGYGMVFLIWNFGCPRAPGGRGGTRQRPRELEAHAPGGETCSGSRHMNQLGLPNTGAWATTAKP